MESDSDVINYLQVLVAALRIVITKQNCENVAMSMDDDELGGGGLSGEA